MHIGGTVAQRCKTGGIEGPTGPELHWCRQGPHQPGIVFQVQQGGRPGQGVKAAEQQQNPYGNGKDTAISEVADFLGTGQSFNFDG